MRQLVKTFKALSDANRLRILKMLEVRPLCVWDASRSGSPKIEPFANRLRQSPPLGRRTA